MEIANQRPCPRYFFCGGLFFECTPFLLTFFRGRYLETAMLLTLAISAKIHRGQELGCILFVQIAQVGRVSRQSLGHSKHLSQLSSGYSHLSQIAVRLTYAYSR